MKEFKKWWDSRSGIASEEYWRRREECSEWAWKAALEFVYDKLGYSQEHEEIKDIIEAELEGE